MTQLHTRCLESDICCISKVLSSIEGMVSFMKKNQHTYMTGDQIQTFQIQSLRHFEVKKIVSHIRMLIMLHARYCEHVLSCYLGTGNLVCHINITGHVLDTVMYYVRCTPNFWSQFWNNICLYPCVCVCILVCPFHIYIFLL
jgi:hypothetical protein